MLRRRRLWQKVIVVFGVAFGDNSRLPLEEEGLRVCGWFGGHAHLGNASKPTLHEMVGTLTPTAKADLSG